MKVALETKAVERGVYVIVHSFLDEDGYSVTPNSGLNWTLTDGLGNVINGRKNVSITPASQIAIVLRGPDLAIDDSNESYYDVDRKVLIQGTYDSVNYGSGLPIKDELTFLIENVAALTGTGS